MNKITGRFDNQGIGKFFAIIMLIVFLSSFFTVSHAEVFTIVPNEPLPATVPIGGTVNASYLVINNTGMQRDGNVVQYLPPNVIVTNEGCGPSFNLAPLSSPGDRCVLNLTVFGAVDAADPTPYNHLFVCFPGGITCAGTLFPLNVIVSGVVPTPVPSPKATFAWITNQNTNQVIYCQVNADGTFSNCQDTGGTGFSTPALIALNPANTIAYIANARLPTGFVSICSIMPNGAFSTCQIEPFFDQTFGVTLNPAGTFAYVTENTFDIVFYCQVNPLDGSLTHCLDAGGAGFDGPTGIAINPSNTLAYITNSVTGSPGTVIICQIIPSGPTVGALQNCTPATSTAFNIPRDIVFNKVGDVAWVTNQGNGTVAFCAVAPGGSLNSCTTTGPIFNDPQGMALNAANSLLYVANTGSNVISACRFNPNGSITSCFPAASGAPLNTPFGIALSN